VVLAYPYQDSPLFPGSVGYSYSSRYQSINDVLLDQAVAGLPFKVIGSYGWRPDGLTDSMGPNPLQPLSVYSLFDLAFYGVTTMPDQAETLRSANLVADLRLFMHQYDVGTVVVVPVGQHPVTVTIAVATAIGRPSFVNGVYVWTNVQARLRAVATNANCLHLVDGNLANCGQGAGTGSAVSFP
jgi:hypothetical protein